MSHSSTPKGVDFSPVKINFTYKGEDLSTWNDNDEGKSHFWNVISCVLPPIETYVIKAVSDVLHTIEDEKLLYEARMFCRQESAHAHTHDELNRMLLAKYPSLEKFEKVDYFLLKFLSKCLSKKVFIGIFVFVEHLTAVLGHRGLERPERWFDKADPALFDMWQWHALEEVAHKSVCYDVHKALNGGYFSRFIGFVIGFFLLLLPGIFARCIYLGFRSPNKRRFFGQLLSHLVGKDGVFRVILKDFFEYFKFTYQPWDLDSRKILNDYHAESQDDGQEGLQTQFIIKGIK